MLDAMQGAMGGAGGDMDSFVDTLMHGILCKEVLYEPLKVCVPYTWIGANLNTRFFCLNLSST